MLAYDSMHEASVAALQEKMLSLRRQYFDQLAGQYNVHMNENEPVAVNFCYPLMRMIATGRLFEPYFYHPDADEGKTVHIV